MFTKKFYTTPLCLSVALLGLLSANSVLAKEYRVERADTKLDEIEQMVRAALPEAVLSDNVALVEKLSRPEIGTPFSNKFDPDMVAKTLFNGSDTSGISCDTKSRSNRDICITESGKAEGQGAYQSLRFNKEMNLGNAVYLRRGQQVSQDPADLADIDLSDKEAYQRAKSVLVNLMGLPATELPQAPRNAKVPYPVKTIAHGWNNGEGKSGSVAIEKAILFQRGLYAGAGDYLDWIPGPGKARIIIDVEGIKEVKVRRWQTLEVHPNTSSAYAKKSDSLIREISQDIAASAQGPIAGISARVAYAAVTTDSGVGLLYPTVQLAVSPVKRDLSEAEQQGLVSTSGTVKQYSLVNMDTETSADDS